MIRRRAAEAAYLFSFSGIKTAVLRYVETHSMAESIAARRQQITASMKPVDALPLCDQKTLDLMPTVPKVFYSIVMEALASQSDKDGKLDAPWHLTAGGESRRE